jgi:hypothetical protein
MEDQVSVLLRGMAGAAGGTLAPIAKPVPLVTPQHAQPTCMFWFKCFCSS